MLPSSKEITIILLFLSTVPLLIHGIFGLNQEGQSLLSWLSTFNSSSSASFFSSWDESHQNPCQWDYIRCTTSGFVSELTITSIHLPTTFPTQLLSFKFLTVLVLSDGNLTGEIPPGLGNLSSLVRLDLSFNALTGIIPREIGMLSNLEVLSLSSNSLGGEMPEEIGNCSQLRQLELFDNQLSGVLPMGISLLWSLEIFRAGGNIGIHGEIPMQISNCKQLTFFGLAETGISGQIPGSIGELKNLRTLSVYTANLTGEIPQGISNCTALENLFIYENQISGEIPVGLGFLKNLKRLLLWQNNLRGTIPEDLGNTSSLIVMDLSLNFLSGELPASLQNLGLLEELLLSDNYISGIIPQYIGNFSRLRQLELDNNNFTGEIPSTIGNLKELTLFFAWENQLNGSIPAEVANCQKLQALDLSHNSLTGSVPKNLYNLRNLSKLLLLSNKLSGGIPPDIGNCTSLSRLRMGSNMFDGQIPSEIGLLQNLTFLELSENQFDGAIPPDIGNCKELELIDLHSNQLESTIPLSFVNLMELNVLDLSLNRLSGRIPEDLGKLTSLNKLVLNRNNLNGSIPKSLGFCKDLQLLDVSSNGINGQIPDEIGRLQGLDILLNLSWNFLTGPLPESFSNFSKLANMDLSHNMLTGSLTVLSNLDNLMSLNVSYNKFSGILPNTKLFHDIPIASFVGNQQLCINRAQCHFSEHDKSKTIRNLIIFVVISVLVTVGVFTFGVIFYIKAREDKLNRNDEENSLQWSFTPFQKLDFSVNDILPKLSESNIVGKGGSGVVYRVETPAHQQVIAVKKLWPKKNEEISQRDSFSAEVRTLGSIRHKNIVRLLGCCNNGKTRLLLLDFISNGSLSEVIHHKMIYLDWEARYKIILGAADGLAYLHHDCIPPIIHRDIKTNNILVGPQFESFLADFGLAKLVDCADYARASNVVAGSYGYMAPEYGYSMRITEKSDVYSYGIVLLEVLTGREPNDPRIPDGAHIVTWVNHELRIKHSEFTSILDQQLLVLSGTRTSEMFQVLGVALLCVNPSPNDRPTMKDVAAMLREIKHENEDIEKPESLQKGHICNSKAAIHCSSFSRSSEPLIRSPSQQSE
ncbi:OLC1v1016645C6 [Oldenlandia corymbosa var. corymbosa]|uniref:OLC1v1016645C6 n=1 Tax=Oldenlandia corymbosa var. corymbosa TaxID=529605 RepID=A0AAV1E7L5_OLDCO|nr:OLC1v1016645C6 [Oldenlandia corymbosa var. corymbosa]